MTEKELYKSVVYDGSWVENNGVSLCNLETILHQFAPRAKYQVWCDRERIHTLYHNIDEAVEKFVELKNKRKSWK
jgi:hypothetical protein